MPELAKNMLIILVVTFLGATHLMAQQEEGEKHNHAPVSFRENDFDAGEFVIEHVTDAYEWHIVSIDDHHISIPLPVILISRNPELHEGKSLHIFMSSKFHHAHADYRGFRISHNEKYKGKIVEIGPEGNEVGKPIDLSITKTVAGTFVSVIVLFALLFYTAWLARRNAGRAPTGLQNLVEPVVIFIRDEMARPAIGEKNHEKFMPILLSLFFFILLNNLLGLIPVFPFGANVTGNISVTMVLALFTFFVTQIRGNKHYWKEIFNPDVPWWLKYPIPLMPIIELAGMFTKPFVLMIRLFANMMAGHIVIAVFISLIFIFGSLIGPAVGYGVSPVSIIFSVFIMLLDVLVSFIQAYVFTLLSALYFGMAAAEDH